MASPHLDSLAQIEKHLDKEESKKPASQKRSNNSSRVNSSSTSPAVGALTASEVESFRLSPNSGVPVANSVSLNLPAFKHPLLKTSPMLGSSSTFSATIGTVPIANISSQKTPPNVVKQNQRNSPSLNAVKQPMTPPNASFTGNSTLTQIQESNQENAKSKKEKKKGEKKEIPPEILEKMEKRPKLTPAETRAKQEAQRAAKEQAKLEKGGVKSKPKEKVNEEECVVKDSPRRPVVSGSPSIQPSPNRKTSNNPTGTSHSMPAIQLISKQSVMVQHDDEKKMAKQMKQAVIQRREVPPVKQISSFTHLPQYLKLSLQETKLGFSVEEVHPSFVQLGLKFETESIIGATARCCAFLIALKDVIRDYECPVGKSFGPDLMAHINRTAIRFLVNCRPLTIGMRNSITWLKKEIGHLGPTLPNEKSKEKLMQSIDQFITDRITDCDVGIVQSSVDKIVDNDVILTYAHSHLVENILIKCKQQGKKIRVIVCDGRPKLEGKELTRRLVKAGIEVTYILLSSLSFVMPNVTKVFLGASAMLSNGTVLSRIGTSVVAMVAHSFNRPVLICCQTFKFSERVQLDSICSNEVGDPNELAKNSDDLLNWMVEDVASSPNCGASSPMMNAISASTFPSSDKSGLKILNLLYDLTPARYVSMVISEVGLIPPTSVPVVIREYRKELS